MYHKRHWPNCKYVKNRALRSHTVMQVCAGFCLKGAINTSMIRACFFSRIIISRCEDYQGQYTHNNSSLGMTVEILVHHNLFMWAHQAVKCRQVERLSFLYSVLFCFKPLHLAFIFNCYSELNHYMFSPFDVVVLGLI